MRLRKNPPFIARGPKVGPLRFCVKEQRSFQAKDSPWPNPGPYTFRGSIGFFIPVFCEKAGDTFMT